MRLMSFRERDSIVPHTQRDHLPSGRNAGILCHLSSLPGPHGIGDMGRVAYEWIDTLAELGVRVWQILPLNPILEQCGFSPYATPASQWGEPLYLSLERLHEYGLLNKNEIPPPLKTSRTHYPKAKSLKENIIFLAAQRVSEHDSLFQNFCAEMGEELDVFACFMTLKHLFHGKPWFAWPEEYRTWNPALIHKLEADHRNLLHTFRAMQFLFFHEWHRVRTYANQKGILIMGDFPFFIEHDSVDVWQNPHLFRLDHEHLPIRVSGAPPDIFNSSGQRWGHPVYAWDNHIKSGFQWWKNRIKRMLDMYDLIRWDHFRGLVSCWEIPRTASDGKNGEWVPSPGQQLLATLITAFPALSLLPEDLGFITPEVDALRETFHLPGMHVYIFGMDNPAHSRHAPHNIPEYSIVATSLHDTAPVRGWYQEISSDVRRHVHIYFGVHNECDVAPAFIRFACCSRSRLVLIPVQDILNLDASARMNTPGEARNQWLWRLRNDQLEHLMKTHFAELLHLTGRSTKRHVSLHENHQ